MENNEKEGIKNKRRHVQNIYTVEKVPYEKMNNVSYSELRLLDEGYKEKLETDPKYSLVVDPEDKYNMTTLQKQFIYNYVQFKNIPTACKLTGIDEDQGITYFQMYSTQQEIRRINLAMYSRQFSSKMLGLDEIGGYLTSLLVDENVAIADRLSPKDKLSAARMLVELNVLKKEAYDNPTVVECVDIESDLQQLSVKSIKQLIENSKDIDKLNEKDKVINQINIKNNLSMEELAYLKNLSLKELLKMQEEINREENKNNE